jgi:hypothetical protein
MQNQFGGFFMSKYKEKYPWIRLLNLYTGKLYNKRDMMDELISFAPGWAIAFGDILLEELDVAIKTANVEDSFMFRQCKEKFGTLRLYHNQPRNSEIDLMCRKFELISAFVCMRCGCLAPDAKLVFAPWIRPMCFDCYCKTEHTDGSEYDQITKESKCEIPTKMIWEEFKAVDKTTGKHIYDKFEVDISDTVEKLRKNWENRVANGTHIIGQ